MNGYKRLTDLYNGEDVERLDSPGELYKINRPREGYDDETVLVRFVHSDDDLDKLRREDNRALEMLFYDENTPNQWNIQLFWAYHEGVEIDDATRSDFESNTRFAIRRCVSVNSLEAFLRPLQTVKEELDAIDHGFDRGDLIQEIIQADLGFLFKLDSTSREERLKKLKQGGTSSPERATEGPVEPYRGIVDSIELGPEFRPPAKRRTLDAKPFTLLHGRNGSGKTSLLDGAALGMVGQIRGKNTQRSHQYEGLNVALTGDEDGPVTLSNKPSAVADRISAWYGFRPVGRQKRYTEFYHVNYHEAGSTTRLADPDENINLEKTIRRSLYGEQLSEARDEKQELVTEARKRIENEEEEIAELEAELEELQEDLERAESLFSTAQTARDELSPAMQELIPDPPSQQLQNSEADAEHDEWVRTWTMWSDRLQRLHESLDIAEISDERVTTPAELSTALVGEEERTETAIHRLKNIKEIQRDQTGIKKLYDDLESAGWGESPPAEAFVAAIFSLYGLEAEDFRNIAKAINEEVPESEETLDEWRTRLEKSLEDRHTELTDKREAIREITDLQAEREELLDEIRARTERYLDITEQVEYCPACYDEQTEEEIRDRERPANLLKSNSGVPDQLEVKIKSLEDALDILTRPAWSTVADELETHFSNIGGAEDYWQVWQKAVTDDETVLPRSTEGHVTRFAEIIRENTSQSDRSETTAAILDDAYHALDDELTSLERSVEDFDLPMDDIDQAVDQLEERRDRLAAGRHILEEHIPNALQQYELYVAHDRQVLQSTESKLQNDAVVVESVAQISEDIERTQRKLQIHEAEKHGYEDGINRLNAVFERADEELTEYVRKHMSAITTLFQAFQRPYQFEQVLFDENDKVRVIRRDGEELEDGEEPEPISDMSSGQRAALALAIFVTNNLTHSHAPPVMLLDEPFAHLDDINTISFFNLLIELATQGDDDQDHQVIFATANEDIADLLERKIGDSPKFRRVPIDE